MKSILISILAIVVLVAMPPAHANVVDRTREALEILGPNDLKPKCPNGGTAVEHGVVYICCKDGYAFNDGTHEVLKPHEYNVYNPVCGCPDGGEKRKSGRIVTCCKDGYEGREVVESSFFSSLFGSYSVKVEYKERSSICNCARGEVWVDE